jgi:radical SAM protein with 4Fe4S-binding SPASM domain
MKEINITTMVGCPNRCWYCPQDVFQENYTSNTKYLTLENFKKLLFNINKETLLNFAGFSENLFNPDLIDMMIHSYNSGYEITFYTTLQGFDDDKLKKLKESNICFNLLAFHEYIGKNFNKKIFDAKVISFTENVHFLQGRIDKIENPCSRANNNEGFNIKYKTGALSCNFYGRNLFFSENTLLPNGDIYLCCMDWGLKHKIGNLFEHHYDSEEFNNERQLIGNLFMLPESDLLCRKCEFSYQI